jgi:hypothetical protein
MTGKRCGGIWTGGRGRSRGLEVKRAKGSEKAANNNEIGNWSKLLSKQWFLQNYMLNEKVFVFLTPAPFVLCNICGSTGKKKPRMNRGLIKISKLLFCF